MGTTLIMSILGVERTRVVYAVILMVSGNKWRMRLINARIWCAEVVI